LGGEEAKRLYQYFYSKVQEGYRQDRVKDGVFQAMMEVALVNDGPVSTLPLRGNRWEFEIGRRADEMG
jgi:D-Tyr-tRNAtyr deacylase